MTLRLESYAVTLKGQSLKHAYINKTCIDILWQDDFLCFCILAFLN